MSLFSSEGGHSGTRGFRAGAYRFLVYALFIATTFTIAGSETSIILMMFVALFDPALWHWLLKGAPPTGELYRGASPPGWVPGVFLLLVATALLSALLNPGTADTLDHMRFHYRVFLPLVLLLALPYVSLRHLLGTFAVFVAIWGLYGAIQYRFGVDWFRPEGQKLIRPYGTESGVFHAQGEFTHHITYGGVMLMATVLLLALATSRAAGFRRVLRILWAVGALLGAVGTTLSLARSAWIGMLFGALVLGLLRLPRRWGVALGVTTVVFVGIYVALAIQGTWMEEHLLGPGSPPLVQRLVRTSPHYDVDRIRMWQAGWLAVQDRPWFGAGMGNAGTVLEPYRQTVSQSHGGYQYMLDAGAGVHNIYLQVAFELGLIGLAAYLLIWIAVFVWSGRTLRALTSGASANQGPDAVLYRAVVEGAIAAMAGSMVAGFFENNAYDKEVQQLMLMLMGLSLFVGLRVLGGSVRGRARLGVHWTSKLYPNYAGVPSDKP